MRIVYDDAKQKDFVALVDEFLDLLNVRCVTKYDYGMERVQRPLVKQKLQSFLQARFNFYIGDKVTHANGIGNNCNYPVYFPTANETQHCANININSGMYGEVFISVEDYNGKRISRAYELTKHGISCRY